MCRGRGAVTDPDAGQRRIGAEHRVVEHKLIMRPQAWQEQVEIGRADIEGWRVRVAEMTFHLVEGVSKVGTSALEIEAGDILIIKETATLLWLGNKQRHRPALIEALEIVHGGLR